MDKEKIFFTETIKDLVQNLISNNTKNVIEFSNGVKDKAALLDFPKERIIEIQEAAIMAGLKQISNILENVRSTIREMNGNSIIDPAIFQSKYIEN